MTIDYRPIQVTLRRVNLKWEANVHRHGEERPGDSFAISFGDTTETALTGLIEHLFRGLERAAEATRAGDAA